MFIYRLVFFLFAGLSIVLPGIAQDEVRLTVSATGGNGSPVLDLKQSDFSLLDAGKPRTIDGFISPQASVIAPQLGTNEYSNACDASQSATIFVVLDTIHTRFAEERDMREMILKFMGRAAQARRGVALAILSPKGLHLYHDYRTSSEVLLAALIKAGLGGMKGGTPSPGLSDTEIAAEAARLTAFSKGDLSNAIPAGQLLHSSLDMPLAMFQDVGQAVYGLPGRKALVWVTNIIPFDVDSKTFQLLSPKTSNFGAPVGGAQTGGIQDVLTGDQLRRLMPIWRRSMRTLFDGGAALYPVEAQSSLTAGSSEFTQTRMRILAQLTGGKAFYGANDPFPEILQTSNGNVAGYVLRFAKDANATPEFHRLQVTVNKAGSTLNAPEGYFPLEGTVKSHAQDDVSLALQSPLAYTGLIFKIRFTGNEDSAGKKKINMVISLAGDAGVLNEATRTVDLALVVLAKDARDTTVGKLNENEGAQVPPGAVAQIKELGFQLKRSIEVPAGDLTMHFVLRDNQNGRMGSLIVPLSVK